MNAPATYPEHTGHHRGRLSSPKRSHDDAGGFPLVWHRHTSRGAPDARSMTAQGVAARLGYAAPTVRYWVVLGWLPAGWTVLPIKGGGRRYVVSEEALWDFLADPRSFPYIDPARIADTDLRAWARECRDGSEWATPAEAGRRFGYYPPYISRLATRGQVRCLRFRNAIRGVYHLGDVEAYAARSAA